MCRCENILNINDYFRIWVPASDGLKIGIFVNRTCSSRERTQAQDNFSIIKYIFISAYFSPFWCRV